MAKRGLALFMTVCILFSCVIYRIISLNFSPYADAGTTYSTKTLTIGETRGNIYDCRMRKLVNKNEKLICAARSGAQSLSFIASVKGDKKYNAAYEQLIKGLPAVFETDKKISNNDMETFSVPQRYEENDFLCHVIGYTDSSSKGVSGIEKAYDELLTKGSGKLSVTFASNANGKTLSGIVPTVNNDNFSSDTGVILTIDEEIQLIAENAMKECDIKSGSCVVLSAYDAGISAMVSLPTFQRNELEKAINSENSPLVNKALSAYAVGSVFKPVIGCAALENNIETDFDYVCEGVTDISDIQYCCNRQTSHGEMNLKSALEVSCNTYFINLAMKMDASQISDFCTNMGFSQESYLCHSMISDAGTLPSKDELESIGEKANIAFGQGGLTATPVQMAAAYLAIADGGYYKYPYLIKGTINEDGKMTETQKKPDSRIISQKTCEVMRENLISVTERGNAYRAQCSMCTVAGKTGTAQSGSYDENGREILRTWFVGFFPANDPLYCVAVLNEDGESGAQDCAPVFSIIAENTMKMLIDRAN